MSYFEFIHQAGDVISSLMVTCLFILIAYGWTLKSKAKPDPEFVVPIVLFVCFVHIFIVGIGRNSDDTHYKYSKYDGTPGFLMVLIKLGLWGWFVWALKRLYEKSKINL